MRSRCLVSSEDHGVDGVDGEGEATPEDSGEEDAPEDLAEWVGVEKAGMILLKRVWLDIAAHTEGESGKVRWCLHCLTSIDWFEIKTRAEGEPSLEGGSGWSFWGRMW